MVLVVGGWVSGCAREAPPEVAKFRPRPTPALDEVPEPVELASATAVVEEKTPPRPKPTPKPAASAPVAAAPPPQAEPTHEPAPKEPTIIGSWRVTDMSHNGQSMPMQDVEMTFTFAEDGTMTTSMSGGRLPESRSTTGTYTLNGDSITLDMQGQSKSGTVTFEGYDNMVLDIDEARVSLTRV